MYKLKYVKSGTSLSGYQMTDVYRRLKTVWKYCGQTSPTGIFTPSETCPYTVVQSFYDRGWIINNWYGRKLKTRWY